MLNSRRPKPHLDEFEASDREYDDELRDALNSSEGENSDSAEIDIGDDGEQSDEEATTQTKISQISFGALAKAASSISRDRRKTPTPKAPTPPPPLGEREPSKPQPPHRTSKNAPQELSSKRAVTRRREVVEPALRTKPAAARDPRFDSAVNGRFDERVFRKNYGFLDGYRNDEMKMLKAEISKTRDAEKRAKLEKKLKSMESQKQSQANKDKVVEVLREHKKKEKQLVKQGKKAFHLKKSSVKKLVLADKYSGMSEKELEKVVERKQKRKAQKERKNIPFARRDAI